MTTNRKERELKVPYMIISVQRVVVSVRPVFRGFGVGNPTARNRTRLRSGAISRLGARCATLPLVGYRDVGAHLEPRQTSARASLHRRRK